MYDHLKFDLVWVVEEVAGTLLMSTVASVLNVPYVGLCTLNEEGVALHSLLKAL